jgi:hypothetical protein
MRLLAACLALWAFQAHAAVSFVGCASTDPTTSSWTVNQPTVIDGDVLVYAFVTNTAATLSGTEPTGVDLAVQQALSGTDSHLAVFRKVAASEGATLQFTSVWAQAEIGFAAVCAYRGVDNTTPLDVAAVSADAGSVTSVSGPAIVPANNGAMIIQIAGADPGGTYSGTDDASPDATERVDSQSADASGYVYWQDYLQPTAASLALDITALTSDTYSSAQVALRAAVGGGGGTVVNPITGIGGAAAQPVY